MAHADHNGRLSAGTSDYVSNTMQSIADIEKILQKIVTFELEHRLGSIPDIYNPQQKPHYQRPNGFTSAAKNPEVPNPESLSDIDADNLPCYVVPVLYVPKQTLPSSRTSDLVNESPPVSLSRPYEKTTKKPPNKFEASDSIDKTKYDILPLYNKAHALTPQEAFGKSSEGLESKESPVSNSHKKDVQKELTTTELNYKTLLFEKYLQLFEDFVKNKGSTDALEQESESQERESYLDLDMSCEKLSASLLYASPFLESKTSFMESTDLTMSPSEEYIYNHIRYHQGKNKHNMNFTPKENVQVEKQAKKVNQQVQVQSRVSTNSLETMTESLNTSTSIQTLTLSRSRTTQTSLRNIDKVLILLPHDKVKEVKVESHGNLETVHTSLGKIGDRCLEREKHRDKIANMVRIHEINREYNKDMAEPRCGKPRSNKTVRIDPKFIKHREHSIDEALTHLVPAKSREDSASKTKKKLVTVSYKHQKNETENK